MEEEQNKAIYFSEKFPIHYNVDEEKILLDTFVSNAEEIEQIFQTFFDCFVKGKTKVKIYVLPPKKESFLQELEVWVSNNPIEAGTLYLVANSFLKKITGKRFEEVIEKVVGSSCDAFIQIIKGTKDLIECKISDIAIGAKLFSETIKNFIMNNADHSWEEELPEKIKPMIKAKDNFYTNCIANENVKGIGFEEEHTFPLAKKDFSKKVSILYDHENEITERRLYELTIVSSVNVKEKNKKWTGRTSWGKEFSFSMEDEAFERLFLKGESPIKESESDDKMLVWIQYHYRKKGKTVSETYAAVKFFQVNDTVFCDLPENETLYTPDRKTDDPQLDLFANEK